MTEAPIGSLAWGQAGIYDAIDDRLVIAAVTRNRTGLTWPVVARAGTGLNVIVEGGWVGVTDCGDRTSAVVGSRTDTTTVAIPGPATGERRDLIWVDPQPDEGRWTMRVINESAQPAFGLALAVIIVPANATTAAQMDIRPASASLERRLMLQATWTEALNVLRNEQTWADAQAFTFGLGNVPLEPGQWYRVKFTANSPLMFDGSTLNGRIGVGMRTAGQPANASELGRANVIAYRQYGAAQAAEVEWVFRHPPGSPRVERMFDGRIWAAGAGRFYLHTIGNQGPGLQMTCEDLGS